MSECRSKSTTDPQHKQGDEAKKRQAQGRAPAQGLQTVSPLPLAPLLRRVQDDPNTSALRPLVARQLMALQRTHGNQYVQRAVNAIHRSPAEPISTAYDVELIPQPNRTSCWAGAMAMMVSYHEGRSVPPQEIAESAGYDLRQSYGWDAIYSAARAYGLQAIPPRSVNPTGWNELLESRGPLWVVETGAPSHAVVLAGMHGDGTPDATEVTINNPWPPRTGAIQYRTFMDFFDSFGGAAAAVGGNVQILYYGS